MSSSPKTLDSRWIFDVLRRFVGPPPGIDAAMEQRSSEEAASSQLRGMRSALHICLQLPPALLFPSLHNGSDQGADGVTQQFCKDCMLLNECLQLLAPQHGLGGVLSSAFTQHLLMGFSLALQTTAAVVARRESVQTLLHHLMRCVPRLAVATAVHLHASLGELEDSAPDIFALLSDDLQPVTRLVADVTDSLQQHQQQQQQQQQQTASTSSLVEDFNALATTDNVLCKTFTPAMLAQILFSASSIAAQSNLNDAAEALASFFCELKQASAARLLSSAVKADNLLQNIQLCIADRMVLSASSCLLDALARLEQSPPPTTTSDDRNSIISSFASPSGIFMRALKPAKYMLFNVPKLFAAYFDAAASAAAAATAAAAAAASSNFNAEKGKVSVYAKDLSL